MPGQRCWILSALPSLSTLCYSSCPKCSCARCPPQVSSPALSRQKSSPSAPARRHDPALTGSLGGWRQYRERRTLACTVTVLFGPDVYRLHDPGAGSDHLHLFPWAKAIEAISPDGTSPGAA